MDFLQKRQAQSQLANQLALQLTGVGANANQVQQAAGAIAPAAIKDSNDAYQMAAASGDPKAMQLAQGMQKFERTNQETIQKNQLDATAKEGAADRASREKMALWELSAKKLAGDGTKKETAGDVSFKTNIDMGLDFVAQLRTAIAGDLDKGGKNPGSGTWESRFGDQDNAAAIEAIPYQLAITYAKIVDPDSVAREGEVAAAQKYLIETGAFASKDKALAQLKRMEETIKLYSRTRAAAKGQPSAGAQEEQQAPNLFSSPFFKPAQKNTPSK